MQNQQKLSEAEFHRIFTGHPDLERRDYQSFESITGHHSDLGKVIIVNSPFDSAVIFH